MRAIMMNSEAEATKLTNTEAATPTQGVASIAGKDEKKQSCEPCGEANLS